MAYRRFSNFRGRSNNSSFRGRFRRAPRLNTVRRPIKWERGNFYFEFLHLHEVDGDRLINTVVPIADINNLISSIDTEDHGRQLTEMTRALIIGGVKFSVVQNCIAFPNLNEFSSTAADDFAGSSSMMADSKVLLVSDNTFTDDTTGLSGPLNVLSNFFTNTTPVTRIQEATDVQSLFPKRIHWQNHRQHNHGFLHAVTHAQETATEVPFHPQDQQVSNSHSSGNLRLRLRLQDDEYLGWWFTSFLNRAETLASFGAEVQFKCTGTIWYRYVI